MVLTDFQQDGVGPQNQTVGLRDQIAYGLGGQKGIVGSGVETGGFQLDQSRDISVFGQMNRRIQGGMAHLNLLTDNDNLFSAYRNNSKATFSGSGHPSPMTGRGISKAPWSGPS